MLGFREYGNLQYHWAISRNPQRGVGGKLEACSGGCVVSLLNSCASTLDS